jgi:diguanylate cyclase (GGDEF)-like protein/PAS domain S-box-containing protein
MEGAPTWRPIAPIVNDMKPVEGLDVSGRAAQPQALETETIDAVIDALLGADPPPRVLAAQESGLGIPVPAAVPLGTGQAISGVGSALELCLPGDLQAIVEAWERVRLRRASQVVVHLRDDPGHEVTMHLVDARHRFGVYLVVLVGTRVGLGGTLKKPELFRPRVCTIDRDEVSVVLALGPTVPQILGWSDQDLVGKKTLDLIHPDDRAPAIANWMEMLGRPGLSQRAIMRYRHRDGQYIWFEVTHSNLLNDPAQRLVRSEMVDVSERMDATERLRAGEQLLRRLTEALPLGVIQIDAARNVVYRNELVLEILATTDSLTLDDQFARVAPADRGRLESALCAVLEHGAKADLEMTIRLGGDARRCSLAVRALSAGNGDISGAILCISDITERVQLREELERRAKYDTLTGCHNRAAILETLEVLMERLQRSNDGVAVVFVDLDDFKAVNDRHGHAAGDELLRLTAERLLNGVREGDVVGRLGGDEFLVVCPAVATPEMALALAHRIAASLAQNVTIDSTTIVPGASIGVAWTDAAVGCDAIVAIADKAMYESKRAAAGPVLALR